MHFYDSLKASCLFKAQRNSPTQYAFCVLSSWPELTRTTPGMTSKNSEEQRESAALAAVFSHVAAGELQDFCRGEQVVRC
jgi:hypothetical protein